MSDPLVTNGHMSMCVALEDFTITTITTGYQFIPTSEGKHTAVRDGKLNHIMHIGYEAVAIGAANIVVRETALVVAPPIPVTITAVLHTQLHYLTEVEIGYCNYKSYAECLEALQDHNSNVTMASEITLIEFELTCGPG